MYYGHAYSCVKYYAHVSQVFRWHFLLNSKYIHIGKQQGIPRPNIQYVTVSADLGETAVPFGILSFINKRTQERTRTEAKDNCIRV